jgi:transmembrane sensor
MSVADDIEERAAHFAMRQSEPTWSGEDQAELEAWLGESTAHKAAFWRLEHGWATVNRISALPPQPHSYRPGLMALRGGWRAVSLAACLTLTLIATGLYLARNSSTVQSRYTTLIGAYLTVPLPDGSNAQLNTESAIRAEVGADHRWIWLDRGEVYFDVAHDQSKQFVIHAGTRRITVLGTKFAVRRDADKVIVSVLDGRVRLEGEGKTAAAGSVTVERGGIAVADGASTLLAAQSVESIERSLTWRHGMLNFDGSTLAEVAAEFNRYNRRQLVIADPTVAAMRIGGSFQTTNVDAFVRLLRDAYGLRSEEAGDRTFLMR